MGGKVSGDWRKADRLFGNDPAGLDESARGIVVLVAVGLLVGVLSGMFGIGGGTVIVPALVWLGLSQRNAAATSMLAIVPTAISGVVSYAAGGNVDWLAAALLFCGMFVGGQVGSWLLSRLPELALRWIFVVFLVFVVVDQVSFVPSRDHQITMTVATGVCMVLLGVVIGMLAGLLGIGGGALAVPALSILFGASDLIARGTSLLAIGNRTEAPGCLVEQVVNGALDQAFADAEALLLARLGEVTLAGLSAGFHERLVARGGRHDLEASHG